MMVYPEHMVISIHSYETLNFQVERLFAEIACPSYHRSLKHVPSEVEGMDPAKGTLGRRICEFMHCLSTLHSKDKTSKSAAADLEDIRQSRHGDSEAYRRLIEQHQEHVGQILWRFSRDRRVHEELVQDVFVEAYLSLGSYRGKAPFAHWLSRIATRVGYRYWKQNARWQKRQTLSLQEWDQLDDKTAQQMDVSQAAMLVHRLLAQLPPRDRLVLTLRYLEQCDIAETARRTGWTKTMVKVQTFRARKKLKRLFAQIGWEVTI